MIHSGRNLWSYTAQIYAMWEQIAKKYSYTFPLAYSYDIPISIHLPPILNAPIFINGRGRMTVAENVTWARCFCFNPSPKTKLAHWLEQIRFETS